MEKASEVVCQTIDKEGDALKELSQAIWSKPELMFEEHFAHDTLCDFLEKMGFKVERKYVLDTAFRATWQREGQNGEEVPHILFVCEYDALPGIGHACGHNLIAQAGAAAGLGLKAALEKDSTLKAKVTVLGTPAEEGGGGKVYLNNAGALDGVDAALMVHPTPLNTTCPPMLAVSMVTVEYHGKPAHASAAPHLGVNALDAAVQAYNSISSMRQQIRTDARVHGVIKDGGEKANIIPAYTKLEYYVREETVAHLKELEAKLENCFKAAALATGCTIEMKWQPNSTYYDLKSNSVLAKIYEKHIERLEPGRLTSVPFKGSTDMGNVSYVVPSLHPFYHIGEGWNHTKEFTTNAGADKAHPLTLNQGKAMALTGLELIANPSLLQQAKTEFKETVPSV